MERDRQLDLGLLVNAEQIGFGFDAQDAHPETPEEDDSRNDAARILTPKELADMSVSMLSES